MDDAHVGWREDETQDGYIQFREYDGDDEVNEAVALPVELYVFIREPLESRLEAYETALKDVLGKMKPVPGRPAYYEIHSRHLRRLRELSDSA